MKKAFVIFLLIACLMFASMPVYGSSTIYYNDYATKLSEIGVFRGTGTGFELDREPTRLEGLVMLVRLLGKETAANQLKDQKCIFSDVPDWGKGYVNYAYKNGLTKGVSSTAFGAETKIDSKSYVTFLLRALGYSDNVNVKDFTWSGAVDFAKSIGLLDEELYKKITSNVFIRDYVAKSSYNALLQPVKGGSVILAEKLVNDGLLTQSQADSLYNIAKVIDYVAIGDSVAAGVRGGVGTPGSESGSEYGYTDDLAKKLKEAGVLGTFNKQFCISGLTAETLANYSSMLAMPGTSAYDLVKNAEIITIDVGADDLLIPLYSYIQPLIADPNSAWYTDQNEVLRKAAVILSQINYTEKGASIKTNIETTLQNILNVNKTVKIYVMDYYNPLPVLSSTYGVDLNTPVKYINGVIDSAVTDVKTKNQGSSITSIDVMAVMSATGNLVPTDIHPTVAGYQAIAEEFWNRIKVDFSYLF